MNDFLSQLIAEGESLTNTISYVQPPPNVMRLHSVYRTSEPDEYQEWLSSVSRFVRSNFKSDLPAIEAASKKLSIDGHRKLIATLKAIQKLPAEPVVQSRSSGGANITIHNTQNVSINVVSEAIKEELTGKDYRELMKLLKDFQNGPTKDKQKVIQKIQGLDGDVVSNILANIMTNPSILSSLFS